MLVFDCPNCAAVRPIYWDEANETLCCETCGEDVGRHPDDPTD